MPDRRSTCDLSILLVVVGVAIAGGTSAQPVPVETEPDRVQVGRVVEVDVPAPSLEGNLLGTATVQGAAVYLPPSYDLESSRRYPVVYLLHGIFDTYGVWTGHFGVPSTD